MEKNDAIGELSVSLNMIVSIEKKEQITQLTTKEKW